MIGDRLTSLRKGRKWTQEEFAKVVNIPRSTLSNYENGRREPDFETTKMFAELFEVSIDYLLGGPQEKQIKKNNDTADIEYLLNEVEILRRALINSCKQLIKPEPMPSFLIEDEKSYADYFVYMVRLNK